MTDKEILKKAIEKAGKTDQRMAAISKDYKEIVKMLGFRQLYYETIFHHDFAKAFWGDNFTDKEKGLQSFPSMEEYHEELYEMSDPGTCWFRGERWKFHLMQMILEEEPLKYLEQFLTK